MENKTVGQIIQEGITNLESRKTKLKSELIGKDPKEKVDIENEIKKLNNEIKRLSDEL